MTPDQYARQSALNTEGSFIVQAPAGSGKTELLVQRFLALLGRAEYAPEEIIAITFTRKAALEMRQRIVEALHAAKNPAPVTTHAYQTWQLACAALQRDQQCEWHLLENPTRLRVLTIDALCASIARQAPLLSGLGISNHLLERNIHEYYLEAARRLLKILEEKSELSAQLAILLLHLDNRVDLLETLFVTMLGRRDQWLPHLVAGGKSLDHAAFRQTLETGLYDVVKEIIGHCDHAIPAEYRHELLALLQFSVSYLQKENSNISATIEDFTQFPKPLPENKSAWLFLAQMLLTKEGTWRLKIDKRQGFPPKANAMKMRMQTLLQQLNGNELLRQRFIALFNAPPIQYTDAQWHIIAALSALLPLLAAELKVLFKEKNVSDFSEVALSASVALGDKECPTDLNLILDTQIRHLLVDEFQDTSIAQFHLLEKLTAGWQLDDGRTLFLVGDPMQSIYRFREAEVGLFLKAQKEGLGSIPLESLILSANFRSTPELIAWINTQFTDIFPACSDISSGAVVFSPSFATKACDKNSGVFLHSFLPEEKLSTIEKVVEVIKQKQSFYPEETIAILVRSRTHLINIIPALKKAHLCFTALEIDSLYKQSIVQDLLALTGALLHLGDRLSWLSVLRAPWCGLTLHDLHAIASKDAKKPVWEILCAFEKITALSIEARQRLTRIVSIFKQSLADRGRFSYRHWIEKTWHLLNGPACVLDIAELSSAEAYFKLLGTFDQSFEVLEITKLHQIVKMQYASPPSLGESRLHVMTIHKAKGLEFDTVIIPHLELKNRSDNDQLLLWLDRARLDQENDLILAPIKAKNQKSDPIYLWLKEIEKEKSHHELKRLLYVAVSRAKKNLHLIATLPDKDKNNDFKNPDSWSFLGLLWRCFSEEAKNISVHKPVSINTCSDHLEPKSIGLRRLRTQFYQTVMEPISDAEKFVIASKARQSRLRHCEQSAAIQTFVIASEAQQSSVHSKKFVIASEARQSPESVIASRAWQSTDQTAKNIGTVIHQILEQIAREGILLWTSQRVKEEEFRWRILLSASISRSLLRDAITQVSEIIQRTLNDARGRWILTNHAEHKSEYALTGMIDKSLVHYVIDRTFIDEKGIRWIIDYKTSAPENMKEINIFLEKMQSLHQEQLEKYAYIMRKWDERFIRLGIYFPAFGGWCAWDSMHNK